ncbi:MAG: hydantoinase/oxoprolinase family protein [Proteobacteria bacterium]|nr:hydantoinase/oxoprolinase family protein [Pseudomonadota bacterium]
MSLAGRGTGKARIGVDIGGTFTDVALERGGERFTSKVLTTSAAPEKGVLECLQLVLERSRTKARDVGIVIHGTTLATNLLIERKGAKTALLTTEGFRDTIEMRTEGRYEQYDINIDNPAPLVPRRLRLPVGERMGASGKVLRPLRDEEVEALVPRLRAHGAESVAIGFLHSYVNPSHESRARAILARRMPGLAISLSSEVSPEMREFERFSTACANAYLQPAMEGYLRNLATGLERAGFACPLFLMHSGGGFMTVETAIRFPVRLVESGPAGGAIFSSFIARQYGLSEVLSFDMGGTTAKICLIEGAKPQTTRIFEAARVYRFKKGSGLPLRIPMIEMVEIGTGGGSIATLDRMGKIKVGPESAGSEPGPACYGRGGASPTVTDADLVMGRINPNAFSGGAIRLDVGRATAAIADHVGRRLGMPPELAAFGISEMADEDMANASRVHAIESGKDVTARTLVAFGGAAPLHATRIAQKIGVRRIIVPTSAGVGSAVGFLRAPVTYEIVRSSHQRLSAFDPELVNRVLAEMSRQARAVVLPAADGRPMEERWSAFMRYVGQGYEIAVPVPKRPLTAGDGRLLLEAFEEVYRKHYTWSVQGPDVEVLSWTVLVSVQVAEEAQAPRPGAEHRPEPSGRREVFDPDQGRFVPFAVYRRERLAAGAVIDGPALIEEDQTTTVVSPGFQARIDAFGSIDCVRR